MKPIKNIFRPGDHFWRHLALRTGLVLVTTFIIVWLMPRGEAIKYDYRVGEPWRYELVMSKYEFPIYKSAEEVKAEEDSLRKQFQPFYNYSTAVELDAMRKLREDLEKSPVKMPEGSQRILMEDLHNIYQHGIMETADYGSLARDTTSRITIVFGRDGESMRIGDVYSTMSAYEQLFSDDRLTAERPLMQKLNLNNYISANLIKDVARSQAALNDLLSSVAPAKGIEPSGARIIDNGEIVTQEQADIIASLVKEMDRRGELKAFSINHVLGNAIYVFILIALFTFYLVLFRKDYLAKPRNIAMLYVLIAVFPICVSFLMQHTYFNISVYVLPLALAAIFVSVFMDTRTAFITHLTIVLISAAMVHYQFNFIIVETVAGLVAIYSLRNMSTRSQVFRTSLFVFIASCITLYALQLMKSASADRFNDSFYYHLLFNSVLLLLAYPLMYLVEKVFGFVSSITLIELSDTNKGLLRQLSEVAPGTFQHSITVGNLAYEIANRIGANSTLVRTGALYHDIGKMKNPAFFTENQQGGINPHDKLTEKESAKIIISHVTDGAKMAEEEGLPAVIRDFILTHHGCGMTKYFYIKYQNEHPNEVVDKEPFTYPGPNPSTREQAILMMADTCEAASHSLKEYTEESISQMVNKLVDQQVKDGFFTECKITFYDIAMAKQVLIERLKAIYHTRIQYPEMRQDTASASPGTRKLAHVFRR